MADVFGTLEKIARNLQESLTVRTVYGDPITAGAVTVVPVARISFGFGGGGGGGTGDQPVEGMEGVTKGASGGGGGGGGAGTVVPIGYIEITESGSRWVPVERAQSDQLLRALRTAARILPIAGRRGIFAALLLIAAQMVLSQLTQTKAPPLPEDLAFGGNAADHPA